MDYISKFPRRRISQRSTCRYNAPSWTLVAKSVWLGTLPESALTGPLLSPCRSSDLTSQGFQMQEHTHTQGFMFLHRRWEGSLSCFPQHFPKMLEVSKRVCGARTGQEEQERVPESCPDTHSSAFHQNNCAAYGFGEDLVFFLNGTNALFAFSHKTHGSPFQLHLCPCPSREAHHKFPDNPETFPQSPLRATSA